MANIITLDVGGTIMRTYKSVLDKLPFFESYMARWSGKGGNPVFIDYDPELFIHLLNKLRDPNYVTPHDANIAKMYDYFGYDEPPKIEVNTHRLNKINELVCHPRYSTYGDGPIRETTHRYKTEETQGKLYVLSVTIKYIQSISIKIYHKMETIYMIDIKDFQIFFERQTGTDIWFLKKDFIFPLQTYSTLDFTIEGAIEDIHIYTLG